MYSISAFLILVGLLSGSFLVAAVPLPVEKVPGEVVHANPGDYLTSTGDPHPLNYNGLGDAAGPHPGIISGPPIDHNGAELYPVIPITSTPRGHPLGENTIRHPLKDYTEHTIRPFSKTSQVALGEGVYVNTNHLASETSGSRTLHPVDVDKLLSDNRVADESRDNHAAPPHQNAHAGPSNPGPPSLRYAASDGRSGSRPLPSTRQRRPSGGRSGSLSPQPVRQSSRRSRSPSTQYRSGHSSSLHRRPTGGRGRSPSTQYPRPTRGRSRTPTAQYRRPAGGRSRSPSTRHRTPSPGRNRAAARGNRDDRRPQSGRYRSSPSARESGRYSPSSRHQPMPAGGSRRSRYPRPPTRSESPRRNRH